MKLRGYLVVKLLCLNPVFELYSFYHFSELFESSQPAPTANFGTFIPRAFKSSNTSRHPCGNFFGFLPQRHSKRLAYLAVADAFQKQPRQNASSVRVFRTYGGISQERNVTGAPLLERTLRIFTVTAPIPV